MDFEEIERRANAFWKAEEERNGFIVESLVKKLSYYLDDQAREEFIESLDEDHLIMYTAINKFGKEL